MITTQDRGVETVESLRDEFLSHPSLESARNLMKSCEGVVVRGNGNLREGERFSALGTIGIVELYLAGTYSSDELDEFFNELYHPKSEMDFVQRETAIKNGMRHFERGYGVH